MNETSGTCNPTVDHSTGRHPVYGMNSPIHKNGPSGAAGTHRGFRACTHVNFHAGKDSRIMHDIIGGLKTYGDRSIF